MCQLIVEFGKQGLTDCEIAMKLNITTQTLYDWAKRKEEFSYSLKMAHDGCDAWFVQEFKRGVNDNKMNPIPLMFLAKTQRHWQEKWDIEVKAVGNDDLHKFDKLFDES
jgi:hypothetical protein